MLNIDFKSGIITYNEFHIDFKKPYYKQLDNLTEDLLQVKYRESYILDIGWYPEFDKKGQFLILLIKSENWDNPVYKKYCRKKNDLISGIRKAIKIAEITERGHFT